MNMIVSEDPKVEVVDTDEPLRLQRGTMTRPDETGESPKQRPSVEKGQGDTVMR